MKNLKKLIVNKSTNGLWEQLDAISPKDKLAERPADSFTTAEYAERYHLSISHAQRLVRAMHTSGKICRHAVGQHSYYTLK